MRSSSSPATPHRAYFCMEAWGIGVFAAALVWAPFLPRPGPALPDGYALPIVLVFGFTTAFAAIVASARRATALEVGAVLAFAYVPLGLAELASLHSVSRYGPRDHVCTCLDYADSQLPLNHLFTVAETTALTCLVIGAVGLAARGPSALRLVVFPSCMGIGAAAAVRLVGAGGAGMGAILALASVLWLWTVRDARATGVNNDTRAALKGARGLAILALGLALSIAVEARAPAPMSDLLRPEGMTSFAADFVLAHRALVVGLLGCGVLLGLAVRSGRSVHVPAAAVMVVLVGVLMCAGGAAHLRSVRIDALNASWFHLEADQLAYAFSAPGGPPLEAGPLPWPLQGELLALPRPAHSRMGHLVLPNTDCRMPEYPPPAKRPNPWP